MPPHVTKDTAASKRRSRHRKRLREAAVAGLPHPHCPYHYNAFEGRCRFCMQPEDAAIHNEDDIPELLKQAAKDI